MICVFFSLLLALLFLVLLCVFETVSDHIEPLRDFNARMRDIMEAKGLADLPQKVDDGCKEINSLYKHFNDLISGKKFASNAFMEFDDALAVIELAHTCTMFEDSNAYKASGICYNNIANF